MDIILIGFGGDGAFKYLMSDEQLEELLIRNFPSRTPFNRNTGKPLLTEFHLIYNVFRTPEVTVSRKVVECSDKPYIVYVCTTTMNGLLFDVHDSLQRGISEVLY